MHKFINPRPTLGISAGFRNNLVMAGLGSLAFAALAPQPLLAAPTLTLKGSFNGLNGNGSNGSAPHASLTPAGNGKFYGTTRYGGENGHGAIFEFDPSGNGSITIKGSFDSSTIGYYPTAALTSAGNGKFYGTTLFGGSEGSGAIFEFDPSGGGSITRKGSFDRANGLQPYAALTSAGNGKFYGTTVFGGSEGSGAIFEFDPFGSGSITLKGSFEVTPIGSQPFAPLTSAGNGKFYGTTPLGTDNGPGSIFEFDPSGNGSITLKSWFEGTNGQYPTAALTSAGNGKFYGTTQGGGVYNAGAIFEFDPSASGTVTLKGSFDGANGLRPFAALTSAGNGKFYGTTLYGGANNVGAIFEFDPSGSGSITLKGSFDGANGAQPFAALTSAGNGKFYGTTAYGGVNGAGAIFEFDPGTNSAPAPGPLPLLGAGAAFGWSRRLRRRIQPVRPVFPIGR
jgi:uncharacterized repeat protein (TIGR03803 family)